jgi:hypothetical protein
VVAFAWNESRRNDLLATARTSLSFVSSATFW